MPIRRLLRTAGITLVELLVVLAIGGVVLSGAIAMMLSHMRTSSQLTALLPPGILPARDH
jgi:prepilin-type N-terminal cleavage/methylation domain-containing protein